jgi:hypothetical protein
MPRGATDRAVAPHDIAATHPRQRHRAAVVRRRRRTHSRHQSMSGHSNGRQRARCREAAAAPRDEQCRRDKHTTHHSNCLGLLPHSASCHLVFAGLRRERS